MKSLHSPRLRHIQRLGRELIVEIRRRSGEDLRIRRARTAWKGTARAMG